VTPCHLVDSVRCPGEHWCWHNELCPSSSCPHGTLCAAASDYHDISSPNHSQWEKPTTSTCKKISTL